MRGGGDQKEAATLNIRVRVRVTTTVVRVTTTTVCFSDSWSLIVDFMPLYEGNNDQEACERTPLATDRM